MTERHLIIVGGGPVGSALAVALRGSGLRVVLLETRGDAAGDRRALALSHGWIAREGIDAHFLRTYGATDLFPPEDADCIVDNTATGATLQANGLAIVETLLRSSTRLYASAAAMSDPARREGIERFALLVAAVLEARKRVMLQVNVPADRLEAVCAALTCMREPTVSTLHGGAGYAVKAAVPRANLPRVIPELKARGATDLVVFSPSQIVP